ncbi:PadR family transcriptional regulator [Pseudonocardia sp. TRM90224]|uniref:PadR family transcriptional regulator n=1 Tax=Pseudonocardia sp. TRM90224 TaxID=2812678 RepID=UPI001E4D1DF2|nr:PadR family transcriptional regulator [Pseudonocardia sp. TRM90224]
MSSARLFALSALARLGPVHGYQIRREAQIDRTELWTDIKPGSLYGVLHRMEREGLVEVVRTEREGNPPERTVYGITEQGLLELKTLRDAALREVKLLPDPVDLALQYTHDLDEEHLAGAIGARRQVVAARLAILEQEFRTSGPYLRGLEPMAIQHGLHRLRAELAWHDALLEELPKLMGGSG